MFCILFLHFGIGEKFSLFNYFSNSLCWHLIYCSKMKFLFSAVLCYALLFQFIRGGIIDGSIYSSSNNIGDSWSIASSNSNGRGIFVTFSFLNVETYDNGYGCHDYVQITKSYSSGEYIKICGNMQNNYMSVYNSSTSLYSLFPIDQVFYYDESNVLILFVSDSSIPSSFVLWYFSGKQNGLLC